MSARSDDHVVILTELFAPEMISTGRIMTEISGHLAQTGRCRVDVVCCQPTYALRGTVAPTRERNASLSIRRVRPPSARVWRGNGGRLVGGAIVSLRLGFFALFRIRRSTTVFAVTNPPALPIVAAILSRVFGCRLVLLVHDVYPDLLQAAGLLEEDSRIARLWAAVNRAVYRRAEQILVIGNDMADLLVDRGAERGSVVFIPNWASPTQERPRGPIDGEPIRFIYSGNVSPLNDLAAVIEAFAMTSPADASLTVLGRGRSQGEVREIVIERRLEDRVTVLDWVPPEEVEGIELQHHVAIVPLRAGMRGISVPSRTYTCLARGLPILAVGDPGSEHVTVVEAEGAGISTRPGDVRAIHWGFEQFIERRSDWHEMSKRSKEAATAYTPAAVLSKLVRAICSSSELRFGDR